MSDYVSRLVARSMGAANVVRPEIGSLHEPRDAPPEQLLAEVDEEASAPPRVQHDEPDAPVRGASAAGTLPVDAPGPAPAGPVPREPGGPPVADVAAPAVEPVPEPAERTTSILVEAPRPTSAGPVPMPRAQAATGPSPGLHSVLPPVSPDPAPDEPPVVQVTIGRVDVRAVQSAPPAAPPAARDREPEAPPRQTLSEYLRKGARP